MEGDVVDQSHVETVEVCETIFGVQGGVIRGVEEFSHQREACVIARIVVSRCDLICMLCMRGVCTTISGHLCENIDRLRRK